MTIINSCEGGEGQFDLQLAKELKATTSKGKSSSKSRTERQITVTKFLDIS